MPFFIRCLAIAGAVLASSAPAREASPILLEMRQIEAVRIAAVRDGDLQILRRLYSAAFRRRTNDGGQIDRETLFAQFHRDRADGIAVTSRLTGAQQIGTTVHVWGYLARRHADRDDPIPTCQFMHIFRRGAGGRWEILLGQAFIIAAPPRPAGMPPPRLASLHRPC